jgi:hypothetical protein
MAIIFIRKWVIFQVFVRNIRDTKAPTLPLAQG